MFQFQETRELIFHEGQQETGELVVGMAAAQNLYQISGLINPKANSAELLNRSQEARAAARSKRETLKLRIGSCSIPQGCSREGGGVPVLAPLSLGRVWMGENLVKRKTRRRRRLFCSR